jgi:hypothetical protein
MYGSGHVEWGMDRPASSLSLKPHQTAMLGASAAAVVAWVVPIVQFLVLPLQYLNTHLHELAHAVMAVLSGGQVQHILVFADGSGQTPVFGGSILLVASAGYVGASVIGATIIYFARTVEGARVILRVLAGVLAFGLLMWVRGDPIGVFSGIGWIAALVAASSWLKGMPLIFAAQFLGVQQCLTSFQSILTLLHVSSLPQHHHSDAMILAQYTGIPAIFWAVFWTGLSLFLVYVTLRAAWRTPLARVRR